MKTITIIQPWATLIVVLEKQYETRSWLTNHRGNIAIHAGKKIDQDACQQSEIKAALSRHGYTAENLPTGVVLATAQLKECWKIVRPNWQAKTAPVELNASDGRRQLWAGYLGDKKEFLFGNYDNGRYAWELADVKQLPAPIPAKGQQGLWNWMEI
ncbi:2-oxoglutarate dehydrogenase E1 [Paenibacillus sp. FSL H7-0756]|uniref:2-oxoglutarate dehydrogenase E1 n=1 Tax=Paenibacillus sp. FSL H7-0756 TaxID=2954738 RepID=UPI0030F56F7B